MPNGDAIDKWNANDLLVTPDIRTIDLSPHDRRLLAQRSMYLSWLFTSLGRVVLLIDDIPQTIYSFSIKSIPFFLLAEMNFRVLTSRPLHPSIFPLISLVFLSTSCMAPYFFYNITVYVTISFSIAMHFFCIINNYCTYSFRRDVIGSANIIVLLTILL